MKTIMPQGNGFSLQLASRGRLLLSGLGLAAAIGLSACSSPAKFEPAPLAPPAALLGANLAWSTQVGTSGTALMPLVTPGRVFVAGSTGTVAALDADTGKDVWRVDLRTGISAGVGSDGQTAAVITQSNDLVAIAEGRELWRVRLPARVCSRWSSWVRKTLICGNCWICGFRSRVPPKRCKSCTIRQIHTPVEWWWIVGSWPVLFMAQPSSIRRVWWVKSLAFTPWSAR